MGLCQGQGVRRAPAADVLVFRANSCVNQLDNRSQFDKRASVSIATSFDFTASYILPPYHIRYQATASVSVRMTLFARSVHPQ
jgi:hypothetical protein